MDKPQKELKTKEAMILVLLRRPGLIQWRTVPIHAVFGTLCFDEGLDDMNNSP